jgi:hypothetical protein
MKRQIRSSVFETNSSSTHSIAITKNPVVIGKYVYFGIGEYGWENDCVNPANYLYTAILYVYSSEVAEEKIEHLKRILDKYDVSYEFEEPEYWTSPDGEYTCLDNGYVDHGSELTEFLEAVFSNEDLLMRYLFGAFVYTGNDNQDARPSGCNIADAEYYDWDEKKWMVNPYHDSENYEYFYKGN